MRSAIASPGPRSPRRSATSTRKSEQDKVKSATFFTAQVDFSEAGDLKLFTRRRDDGAARRADPREGLSRRPLHGGDVQPAARPRPHLELCRQQLPAGRGAARRSTCSTGISDTTNLPAGWHRDYLETLYKGNKLAEKGGISVAGTPIDIGKVKTPTYVQAGREDHIAPPESVWKIMDHFAGPKRFVLAGSGHIAGVVNPPAAQKYQYWVNDQPARDARSVHRGRRASTRAAGGRTGSNG